MQKKCMTLVIEEVSLYTFVDRLLKSVCEKIDVIIIQNTRNLVAFFFTPYSFFYIILLSGLLFNLSGSKVFNL